MRLLRSSTCSRKPETTGIMTLGGEDDDSEKEVDHYPDELVIRMSETRRRARDLQYLMVEIL